LKKSNKEDVMRRATQNGKDQLGRGFIIFFLLVSLFLGGSSSSLAAGVDYPTKPVLCIAPAKPGSGFDTTIRAVTTTLGKEKLISVALPVENMSTPVAGMATIMLRHKNNPYMIAVQSLSGLLSYASGMSPYSHKDWTPIARLISAYYGVMVRYDSPYKTLGDLVKDLKENIGKVPFSGGMIDDRIAYGAVFFKAGIDITKINYAAYSGGTEASTVVLEGSAKVLISSIDDVMGLLEAKRLRMLAVSSGKRLEDALLKDVPTVRESGVDTEWENFRYILGGPSMPGYAVKYWQGILTKMVKTPTWQEMLARYRWGDTFMVDGLGKFLDDRLAVVTDVVNRLGMGKKK
jgi:putative tricarboxylic transport membrane protein